MGGMAPLKIPSFAEPDELGEAGCLLGATGLVTELHEASDEGLAPLPEGHPGYPADETGLPVWIINDSR
jgi:hypothetical protein